MAYNIKKRTPVKNTRFRKRWYFDATIGKSVPIIGGTGLRMGSGPLTKRSINTAVKSAMINTLAKKTKVINPTTFVPLNHDTWHTLNPLGNIPIAVGEASRLSTDIHVKQIKFTAVVANLLGLPTASRTQAIYVRAILVRSEVDAIAGIDTFASGLGGTNLLVNGQNSTQLGMLDKDKCTVLADQTFRVPQSTVDGCPSTLKFDFNCPLQNFPFKYESLTSNYSSVNKNVYLVLAPYLLGPSIGTSACEIQFSMTVDFADGRQ